MCDTNTLQADEDVPSFSDTHYDSTAGLCTAEKFRNVFKQGLVVQLAFAFVWYT